MAWTQATTDLHQRQLTRMEAIARTDTSPAAKLNVITARMVQRTQPPPSQNTFYSVVTWVERVGELMPRYLAQPDGPQFRSEWSDLTQHELFRGPTLAEAKAATWIGAVAVPENLLENITGLSAFTLTHTNTYEAMVATEVELSGLSIA